VFLGLNAFSGSNKLSAALACAFRHTSCSYEGIFGGRGSLDLKAISGAFGVKGSLHEVTDNGLGLSTILRIDDVDVHYAGRNEKNTITFVVVKAELMDLNVSIKLYHSRRFQLFGLADTHFSARDGAGVLLRFVAARLNDFAAQTGLNLLLSDVDDLKEMAVSAVHDGVSECGLRFDIDALENALRKEQTRFTSMTISRNARNGALVVRWGDKIGAQMFYGTGTTQLMGVRGDTACFLERLRALVEGNADVVCEGKARKRKRGVVVRAEKAARVGGAAMADVSARRTDACRTEACESNGSVDLTAELSEALGCNLESSTTSEALGCNLESSTTSEALGCNLESSTTSEALGCNLESSSASTDESASADESSASATSTLDAAMGADEDDEILDRWDDVWGRLTAASDGDDLTGGLALLGDEVSFGELSF